MLINNHLVPNILTDLFDLFFPPACINCSELLQIKDKYLCFSCLSELPLTHFSCQAENELEIGKYNAKLIKYTPIPSPLNPRLGLRNCRASSTQNPEYIASYLRGMAKLAAFKSYQEEERADYLAANKGIDAGFNKVWSARMADEEFRDSVAEQFGLDWLTKEKQDKQLAEIDAEIARVDHAL